VRWFRWSARLVWRGGRRNCSPCHRMIAAAGLSRNAAAARSNPEAERGQGVSRDRVLEHGTSQRVPVIARRLKPRATASLATSSAVCSQGSGEGRTTWGSAWWSLKTRHLPPRQFQRFRWSVDRQKIFLAHEGLPLLGAEDHRMDVAAWLPGLGLESCAGVPRQQSIGTRCRSSHRSRRGTWGPSPRAARCDCRARRRGARCLGNGGTARRTGTSRGRTPAADGDSATWSARPHCRRGSIPRICAR
jgi:hypothetical protein